MAAALLPIKLEDLDREELLQLLQDRPLIGLRSSDLWDARYEVLVRRSVNAADREEAAAAAYYPVMRPVDPSTMSARAWSKLRGDREAKRRAYEVAQRAYRRVAAARDRAFDALMDSYHQRNAA